MKIKISTKISKNLLSELKKKATNIRRRLIVTSAQAGSSHIGSSLSSIDILTTLYFDILNIKPDAHSDPKRDRFIMSKGHAGLGLYSTLAERGFISNKLLENYSKDKSTLTVHPVRGLAKGIEATTGSLGHGLGMGLGIALALKRERNPGRVFVLLSDGECDTGSTWEAIMLAGHLKLDNLVAIVDYNKIQSFGTVKEVLDLEPFADKWRANNWKAVEIDGHNFEQLISTFRNIPTKSGWPTAVIAHTIKGKGIPFMENKLEWHYKNIKPEELEKTLAELY